MAATNAKEFIQLGGTRADLKYDIARGWCDLGVPSYCGVFTSFKRLVSISRGRGWFLFRI